MANCKKCGKNIGLSTKGICTACTWESVKKEKEKAKEKGQ